MKTVTKIQISREEALMALTALVRQTDPTLATAEVKDYESKMLPGGIPGMELSIANGHHKPAPPTMAGPEDAGPDSFQVPKEPGDVF